MPRTLAAFVLLAAVTLSLAVVTRASGQDMDADQAEPPRVLIVLTNHATLGDTGKPTGYYLSEAAHPWQVFTDAGFDIHFASPRGGPAPADPKSLDKPDEISQSFLDDEAVAQAVQNTRAATDLDAAHYEAIFFAGGHGTMWDFPDSEPLTKLAARVYDNGGVVAAVCHGPAALVNVKLPDGTYLVAGKTVSAFTDEEEAAVGLDATVPFLLEKTLRDRGADFVESPNFQPRVAVSDRLVTGQNPASATGVAQAVAQLLGADITPKNP